MSLEENVKKLTLELLDLVEEQQNLLGPHEIANRLIAVAVNLLLTFAPNERLAWKTLNACIQNGVSEHEEAL